MFGLGFSEIITLIIVIVVFINPKNLPMIVRKIGVVYGKIMRQINTIKKTFNEFEEEVKAISEMDSSRKELVGKDENDHTTKGDIK